MADLGTCRFQEHGDAGVAEGACHNFAMKRVVRGSMEEISLKEILSGWDAVICYLLRFHTAQVSWMAYHNTHIGRGP